MKCCELYHGVFGAWGWECVSAGGTVTDESLGVFENQEECVEDARLHGYCIAQDLQAQARPARPVGAALTTPVVPRRAPIRSDGRVQSSAALAKPVGAPEREERARPAVAATA